MDYKTITPIRNPLKIKKSLCNPFLGICVIKKAKGRFSELSFLDVPVCWEFLLKKPAGR